MLQGLYTFGLRKFKQLINSLMFQRKISRMNNFEGLDRMCFWKIEGLIQKNIFTISLRAVQSVQPVLS